MIGSRDQVGARFLVLGLALESMQGRADANSVGRATIAVGEVFAVDDPFSRDVRDFSRRFDQIRRDPELLSAAGAELMRSVMRSCWPGPSPRVDLEG